MAASDDLDKRVFDALVRHTVHAFVSIVERDAAAATLQKAVVVDLLPDTAQLDMPALLDSGDKKDDDEDEDARYTHHCQRVLNSQYWTTEQLVLEKRAMQQYLLQHGTKSLKAAPTALYWAFEAYALLKLFLLERACVDERYDSVERLVLSQQKSERKQFFLMLHVQLELFTKYFERSECRKVRENRSIY